jgi:hypothetical protein
LEEHVASIIKVASSAWYLIYVGFLLGVFFQPGDGDGMFLRNVGLLSTDYTALYPRR